MGDWTKDITSKDFWAWVKKADQDDLDALFDEFEDIILEAAKEYLIE